MRKIYLISNLENYYLFPHKALIHIFRRMEHKEIHSSNKQYHPFSQVKLNLEINSKNLKFANSKVFFFFGGGGGGKMVISSYWTM